MGVIIKYDGEFYTLDWESLDMAMNRSMSTGKSVEIVDFLY